MSKKNKDKNIKNGISKEKLKECDRINELENRMLEFRKEHKDYDCLRLTRE